MLSSIIARNQFEVLSMLRNGLGLPWEQNGLGGVAQPLVRFVGGGGTFTRASEASYHTTQPNTTGGFLSWALADVIREDKRDDVSGLYLFEPAQANLCLHSEALDNAVWVASGAVTVGAGVTTAPDGESDCKTVSFPAVAGAYWYQAFGGTVDATTYMASAWVRRPAGAGNVRLYFPVLRGAGASISGDLAVGTTWTRVEFSAALGTGANTPRVAIANGSAGIAQAVEVWGFQVESLSSADACPTSYIRTTTAAGTRSADRLVYTSYPDAMRTGKWRARFAPISTSAEHTVTNTICSFATAVRDQCIILSADTPSMRINAVTQYAAATATWSRNQVLDLTFDMVGAVLTTASATTGNGAGAQGIVPTFSSTAHLAFGSSLTGNVDFTAGRIGEPFLVAPSAVFDFGSISGLAVDLDARDLTAGAIVSWIDRKNGYNFAGTATCGTDINGMPTVTANGTTDILTSTTVISQLSGVSAVTIVGVYKDAYSTVAAVKMIEHGNDSSVDIDAFSVSASSSGGRYDLFLLGDVGRSEYYITETLATARVITGQFDKSLATAEAGLIRRDGAVVGATLAFNTNNTNTFGSHALNLFARNGGAQAWPGSIAKLVIYNRALTAGEMTSVERACGLIARILVA